MIPPASSAPATADDENPVPQVAPQTRFTSIDAYRGLVMLLMMAEVLRLCAVAKALPGSAFWSFLCWHQSHVEWIGCSLHDLIQPSFSFLVGVALPFSLASRAARGQSIGAQTLHAAWRALLLILLGVFLRSVGQPQTYWTFEDTLSQIGMGYFFLYLLGRASVKLQWTAFVLLVVGYWAAFALWPLPPAGFDFARVGVSAEWLEAHRLSGFAAHWTKNANLAWAFDTWFLNLFPREKPFVANGGGYATLSFIPTLATMVFGLLAGGVLRSHRSPGAKVRWLMIAGLAALAAGWLLGAVGVCPVVKRIWTPNWVLFSGGWCCLLLAAFYAVTDLRDWRRWPFPLLVVGANSIAAYVIAHLFEGFVIRALKTNLGVNTFRIFGPAYEPFLLGAATLLVLWLMLYWMWKRKIFLRI